MTRFPKIYVLLLISGWLMLSGFTFRCWFLCTDQTSTQHEYIASRDKCREYAQLRIDTDTSSPQLMDEKTKKSKLVALFSACMADDGWTVPDGKTAQQPAPPTPVQATAAAPVPVKAAPVAAAPAAASATPPITAAASAAALSEQQKEKAFLTRASECNFARHSAGNSSIAATRARACDLECAQRLKAKPKAPRPAACPAGEAGE